MYGILDGTLREAPPHIFPFLPGAVAEDPRDVDLFGCAFTGYPTEAWTHVHVYIVPYILHTMALSFTQLAAYRRCPRQYEYCYIKKIPKGVSPGEAFGASVHNALKKWGDLEMMQSSDEQAIGDKRLAVSRQPRLFVEEQEANRQPLSAIRLHALWHEHFPLNAFPTRVEADAARMRGEELMTLFYAWWSERPREVVAVEKGFSIDIGDERLAVSDERLAAKATRYPLIAHRFTLTGRFDRIERTPEGLHVIDFKTSQPRTQAEVDADLQLSIYALAAREDFGELPVVLSLLHITEDGILEMRTTRHAGQVQDAIKQITAIHGRITEKDFRPTPAAAVCKWCPYKGVCDVAAV